MISHPHVLRQMNWNKWEFSNFVIFFKQGLFTVFVGMSPFFFNFKTKSIVYFLLGDFALCKTDWTGRGKHGKVEGVHLIEISRAPPVFSLRMWYRFNRNNVINRVESTSGHGQIGYFTAYGYLQFAALIDERYSMTRCGETHTFSW